MLIILAFYGGAIAQYNDLVASKNINSMLVQFTKTFLEGKYYSEDTIFQVPQDTVWSTLKGMEEKDFHSPCIFYGTGYSPFDYSFEHKKFLDGSEHLRIFFRERLAFDKIEFEITYENTCLKSSNFLCILDVTDRDNSYYYACKKDMFDMMLVSTNTVKEFEEKLKMILPYL